MSIERSKIPFNRHLSTKSVETSLKYILKTLNLSISKKFHNKEMENANKMISYGSVKSETIFELISV